MTTGLHIALIEDNADLRLLLTQGLQSLGHIVFAHESAEDLLEHRGSTDIDVYLVDLNLPGEDGLSLVRRLRATAPGTGIVVLTARDALADRIQGYEGGADVYLVKPIALPELAAVISRLSRRQSESSFGEPSALRLRKGRLFGQAGEVKLSFDEAIVLEALLKAPAQRLATWQLARLMEATLDEAFRANLPVRMARLRKKLRSAGAPEGVLEPLRNHGYQLNTKVILDLG